MYSTEGEIMYKSSVVFNFGGHHIHQPTMIRNNDTDYKFISYAKYKSIIRKKKLERINVNGKKTD